MKVSHNPDDAASMSVHDSFIIQDRQRNLASGRAAIRRRGGGGGGGGGGFRHRWLSSVAISRPDAARTQSSTILFRVIMRTNPPKVIFKNRIISRPNSFDVNIYVRIVKVVPKQDLLRTV